MNRIARVRHSGGGDSEELGASFEAQYAAAADRVLNGIGPRGLRRHQDAEGRRSVDGIRPAHGAEYPHSPFGQALQQIAQLTKADVGLEVAFADIGGWDTHVNQGAGPGAACDEARRLRRAAWRRSSTDLGERMADTVVLTMSEFGRAVSGKRQSRHRSWSRERDDGHRRRRARRTASTGSGRAWRSIGGTRGAIWRSRPTFATCSGRSSCATLALPIHDRSFPAIRCKPRTFPAFLPRVGFITAGFSGRLPSIGRRLL